MVGRKGTNDSAEPCRSDFIRRSVTMNARAEYEEEKSDPCPVCGKPSCLIDHTHECKVYEIQRQHGDYFVCSVCHSTHLLTTRGFFVKVCK